ncbi:MAG: O-antigen ligase family protein [bacterium]
MKSFWTRLLTFLDANILTILTALLIVVVPLYPKLPLADLLEGYIVRLRLEDILIAFACLVYFVQLLRKRIALPTSIVARLMLGYIIVGFLSSLSALFITNTVPLLTSHVFKLGLHLFRRIEYFSLFFIAYSSIRTRRDLKLFVAVALATLLAVVVYGFGQKYLYWPAFSTMNREFSKGMRLYLTPTSRVMSTFGGHYDYGAYLMIILTGLISGIWLVKNKLVKIGLGLLALGSYWSLLLTSSRSSFGGYVAGVTAIALLLAFRQGFWWSLKRYVAVMIVSLVMMLTIGDLSTRFLQVVQSPDAIHQFIPWVETGKIEENIYKTKDFFLRLAELKRNLTEPKKEPPKNGISTDELAKVAVPSDVPPTDTKPLPPDVTQAEDDVRNQPTATATVSAGSNYSENALKYGLSAAIRLDVLWPQAIASFKKNPLLGTGYSTLVKGQNEEFTQAESTDNDYLRMLGETGLLGTLLFLSLPLYLGYLAIVAYKKAQTPLDQVLLLSMLGASIAMLVNATYIDVFESSKVAYTFWLLAAIMLRTTELVRGKQK